MKKQTLVFVVMACLAITSCRRFHHGDIDITYNESDRYFSMKAWFNENRTRDIEHYMDQNLGEVSSMSFVNTRIDGQISLDDQTSFYIRKYPGYLQIKMDKDRNSSASYDRVKNMCRGIKGVLAK